MNYLKPQSPESTASCDELVCLVGDMSVALKRRIMGIRRAAPAAQKKRIAAISGDRLAPTRSVGAYRLEIPELENDKKSAASFLPKGGISILDSRILNLESESLNLSI